MTCADFTASVSAYALGILDADERAACDAHLASKEAHDGCNTALREANEAVALIALAETPILPPPSVWQAIERTLDGEHAVVHAVAPVRGRSSAWLAWSVAAAAIVALVWVVVDRDRVRGALAENTARATQDQAAKARCTTDLAEARADSKLQKDALELLQRPGTRLIALAAQPGAGTTVANVILHTGDQRAFLVGQGLSAPSGKDFELWFIRGDQKIAAGLLRGDGTGALLTAIDPKLLTGAPPDAIAVTLEPAGGGDAPRGPIVLVGKI